MIQWGEMREWVIAGGAWLLTALLLLVLRKLLKRSLHPLSVAVLSSTRTWFLFMAPIYPVLQIVKLHAKVEWALHKFFVIVLLFQATLWGLALIRSGLETYLKKFNHDPSIVTAIGLINFSLKFLLYSIVALVGLSNLGVNITALVAGLGVGGIAVALAAQSILGDLFASLTIVLDKPFVVGDSISLDGYAGAVEYIGLKTTHVRSATGEQIVFSNSDLLRSRIRNMKRMTERKVTVKVSVAFGTVAEQLRKIPEFLKQAVYDEKSVRFESANLRDLGPYAIEFELAYWISDVSGVTSLQIQERVLLRVLESLEKEKIQWAVPLQTALVAR